LEKQPTAFILPGPGAGLSLRPRLAGVSGAPLAVWPVRQPGIIHHSRFIHMKKLIGVFTLLLTSALGMAQAKLEEKPPASPVVNAFDIMQSNAAQNTNYGVFMRIPSISSGVYTLKKGATDEQTPHTKDEIYYVVKGKAKILIGKASYEVKEGSLVFVEAYKEHKFYDITEDLGVVVVFSAEQPAPSR
jgi:mannose-6-phosphate isomerase-like protein (cupin superfamily)